MPNHVRTVIKFKNLRPDAKIAILNRITSKTKDEVFPLNRVIDFDKIIPEPRTIEECPEDCRVNKESHIEISADRPWFDWYAWHNKYWDTKWNAYDSYVQVKPSSILFIFSTAWSPAMPIFKELSRLGYDMEVRWADEDIGHNCGKLVFNASEHAWTEVRYAEDLKDSRRFARDIWRKY